MNTTQNSFAQSSSYKVFIPFLGDDIVYTQNVQLPSFSLNPPEVLTSGKKLYTGGDHIDYGPITVGFICDEQFSLYKKVLKYILARIHQNNGEIDPIKEFSMGVEVTDSKGITVLGFQFYGCKLNNLGALSLISNAEDAEHFFDIDILFDDWELVDHIDTGHLSKKVIKS